jgi:hypothetical protein
MRSLKNWSCNFQHLRKVYRRPGDFYTPVPTKFRSSNAQQLRFTHEVQRASLIP